MPTRSLASSVLRWPDASVVDRAARTWAEALRRDPNIKRVGYFGSYARGDWGVGSDIDLLVVVESAQDPFERRALGFHTDALPVPADVLVYTESEWRALTTDIAFHRRIEREAVWVVGSDKRDNT